MDDRLEKSRETFAGYQRWLDDAAHLKSAFESLGEPLPSLLGSVAGGEGYDSRDRRSGGLNGAANPIPERPRTAKSDWVWIPAGEMGAQGMLLALLRTYSEPIPPKEISEKVCEYLPEANIRSVYNVGPRLEKEGIIRKSGDGWELLDEQTAPILSGEFVWGPANIFTRQELAAHRRRALLHILGESPAGLQMMQATRQLEGQPFCKATVNSDLIKQDLEKLRAEGKVKRISGTKKWTIS